MAELLYMFSKCFTFLVFYGIFVKKAREIFTHHYTGMCVETKKKRKMNWLTPNLKDKWLSWIRIQVGIPDHLTCLLRNLYAGQEARVRTGHRTTDWSQIGKGIRQGCILSSCLFNLYTEYILRNARWMKHKLESSLPGEISITSDMQMTPLLWQKVKKN